MYKKAALQKYRRFLRLVNLFKVQNVKLSIEDFILAQWLLAVRYEAST